MKKFHPKSNEELKQLVNDLSINLADIDTSAVEDFSYLAGFDCARTDWSGIGSWDTSRAKSMEGMLAHARNFNEQLSWDTSNVADFSLLFNGCSQFNQPLNFDTSSAENLCCMLADCQNFNQPLNFNTAKVRSFTGMLAGCESFDQFISFDFSHVNRYSGVNNFIKGAAKMSLDKININQTNFKYLYQLQGVRELAIERGWLSKDGAKFHPRDYFELKLLVFDGQLSLSEVNIGAIDDLFVLFYRSPRKDFAGISSWDLSCVRNMCSMFSNCHGLNEPLELNAPNATNLHRMFQNCSSLNSPVKINAPRAIDLSWMFYSCKNLSIAPEIYAAKGANMQEIFANCPRLMATVAKEA